MAWWVRLFGRLGSPLSLSFPAVFHILFFLPLGGVEDDGGGIVLGVGLVSWATWFTGLVTCPGGGLGIYTDRDQRSIFWVLNFENLYFFGYWSKLLYFFGLSNKCCIFLGCQINAVFLSVLCIQRYFFGPILFTRYFSKHSSSLL